MKCSYCDCTAEFKCACKQPFMCQFHRVVHLNTQNNHQYENLDQELGDERLSQLRLKLMKRIQEIGNAKNELASKTDALIKTIENAFEKASDKLDEIINNYLDLLNRNKFFGSEVQEIENIELFDIDFQTTGIDEISSIVQNTFPIELITYNSTNKNEVNLILNQNIQGFLCGVIKKDGQTLVVGDSDSVIQVWNLVSKKQDFMLLGHHSDVLCITLTENEENIISGSLDNTVRVWKFHKNSDCAVLKGHKGGILCICYVEKPSLIVSGDNKCKIIVWDFNKHYIVQKLSLSTTISSLVLMKNKSWIIACEGKNIVFLEIETLKKQKIIEGHSKPILCLAIDSYEKRMVSGSEDKSIIYWDLNSFTKIFTLVGHNGHVNSLAMPFYGQFIVSVSKDKTVCVWKIIDGMQAFNYKYASYVNMLLPAKQDILLLSKDFGIGKLNIGSDSFQMNQFLKPSLYNLSLFNYSKNLFICGFLFLLTFWNLIETNSYLIFMIVFIMGTGLSGIISSFLMSFIILHIFRVQLIAQKFIFIANIISSVLYISESSLKECSKINCDLGHIILLCMKIYCVYLVLFDYLLRSNLNMIRFSTHILNKIRRNRLIEHK